MNNLTIRKYGGSCLLSPQQIKETAAEIAKFQKEGKQFIIVVSALGETTNELLSLARQISLSPNRRELDMLLSAGERISMSLMSIALHELQCPAISFTGSQAGLMTDSNHSGAQIIDVKPIRVDEALKENQIVVLAGFQGVDPKTKEVTTLGRGGSDTTAVAMAAHYKSPCEIFKDVPGICSSDPKLGFKYKVYSEISYEALEEMCFWGASVLHHKSVSLALSKKVPLAIMSAQTNKSGTKVYFNEPHKKPTELPLAVNSHKKVFDLNLGSPIESFFNDNDLPQPQILHRDKNHFLITDSMENLDALHSSLNKSHPELTFKEPLSSVTLTYQNHLSNENAQKAKDVFKSTNMNIDFLQRPQSITAFVSPKNRIKVLEKWHDLIIAT